MCRWCHVVQTVHIFSGWLQLFSFQICNFVVLLVHRKFCLVLDIFLFFNYLRLLIFFLLTDYIAVVILHCWSSGYAGFVWIPRKSTCSTPKYWYMCCLKKKKKNKKSIVIVIFLLKEKILILLNGKWNGYQ